MSKGRRTTTLLVLAGYLLMLTVGGWFHDHGGHRFGLRGHACSARHDHDSLGDHSADYRHHVARGHDHGRAPVQRDRSGEQNLPITGDGDQCPVCKFLAQKPIPPRDVRQVTCVPLEQECVRAKPVRRAEDIPSTHHSRAPPSVA